MTRIEGSDSPAAAEGPAERARWSRAAFLDWAQYPPTSRPIRERPDRVQPDFVSPREARLFDPEDPDPRRPDAPRTSMVLAKQDRYSLTEGERVTLEVACLDSGVPAPCEVGEGRVSVPSDMAPPAGAPLSVAFDAISPGRFRAVFAPSQTSFASYAGPIRIDADVTAQGLSGKATFDVLYSPEVPARLTGAAEDHLEAGSVVICADIDVTVRGRYLLDARVTDRREASFAFVSFRGPLEPGRQKVCFTVFGKLALDEAADAPFILRDVEGMLLLEDTFPDRASIPTWRGPLHETRAYPRSAFSDAPWDSDWKRRQAALWDDALGSMDQQ